MEMALGTVCAVNLFEDGNAQLYAQIFARIHAIDRTMTAFPSDIAAYVPDSAVAEGLVSGVVAINERAGIEPVPVRSDLIAVLETALYYAELSGGAFDPTVGPLVTLWGIGLERSPLETKAPTETGSPQETWQIPDEAAIADALALVNWRDVVIDREAGTVFLRRKGMALDLGAIAKGYAGDEAARIAKEAAVHRAIIDLGGNIVTLGWRHTPADTTPLGAAPQPWRIGIQNPLEERGAYIGIVLVHDTSIVTSGVYERYVELEGKRYHHLFSPENGYPADNGLLSVSIVTKNSASADALSTAVFVMGFEKGKALIDSIPATEAIFVFDDRRIIITAGLSDTFTLTDNTFTLDVQP